MLKERKEFISIDHRASCGFYLGAIITTLICQMLAAMVSVGLMKKIPDIAQNGDFNGAFMMFVQLVNGAFVAGYCFINKRKLNFSYFKNTATEKNIGVADIVVPLIAAPLLLVTMYLPTVWYGFLVQAMGIPPEAGALYTDTASAVVMIVIASVFLAPVCEETIYRGVLFHGIKSEKSTVYAVFISALAFMLMHMNPLQIVFQFALGVLSAFIALRSGKLLPSILLHAVSNALALVIDMTPLGTAIGAGVEWLTANIAAAFFITLGLFVAGGAALFFIVDIAFGRRRRKDDVAREAQAEKPGGELPQDMTDSEKAAAELAERAAACKRRDGFVRLCVGLGICVIMLIFNAVSLILS